MRESSKRKTIFKYMFVPIEVVIAINSLRYDNTVNIHVLSTVSQIKKEQKIQENDRQDCISRDWIDAVHLFRF